MPFFALLIKELRSQRRQIIWFLIVSLIFTGVVIGLLCWSTLHDYGIPPYTAQYQVGMLFGGELQTIHVGWNNIAESLYYQYSLLLLLPIIFLTPAFTAMLINSEKQRHTFDLLVVSRLSALQLVAAKLLAGISYTLLLILISTPMLGVAGAFGNIAFSRILSTLLVYVVAAIVIRSLSLLCSALLQHPAASTALAYSICGILFLVPPFLLIFSQHDLWGKHMPLLMAVGNPFTALMNTYPLPTGDYFGLFTYYHRGILFLLSFVAGSTPDTPVNPVSLWGTQIDIWQTYTILGILLSAGFLLLSARRAKEKYHHTKIAGLTANH